MAASWWKVLKTVPWSEVIHAAPQVATGARRLWDTVARRSGTMPPPGPAIDEIEPQEDVFGIVMARLDKNETTVGELRGQMLSASELIANLADQNAQLIAKMDVIRTRMLWLGVATGVSLLLALIALALVAART
jgi:hypothetical protein